MRAGATLRPWRVRFYCCGIPSGIATYETWERADDAREMWLDGAAFYAAPHDRHGIIEAAE